MAKYSTEDLKSMGFSPSMLKMLRPRGTETVGIMNLGGGYKARSYRNMYYPWSIAQDITATPEKYEQFMALASKRGVDLAKIPDLLYLIQSEISERTAVPVERLF